MIVPQPCLYIVPLEVHSLNRITTSQDNFLVAFRWLLFLIACYLFTSIPLLSFNSPVSLSFLFLIINQFLHYLILLVRKVHVMMVLLVQAALLRS